eukprot:4485644-Amphidinium_carterae.1
MVDDGKIVETPIAEVTTEGHHGVEAMLDSGAGASVCSPNDFLTIAIDTQSEVTKVYRCADGRELKVYGYKWVKASWAKPSRSCRSDSQCWMCCDPSLRSHALYKVAGT